jgi:hypothetical protein
MNDDYQFHQAVPARDALEQKRKAALKAEVEKHFNELIGAIKKDDPSKLKALLDFYTGKVTRWSSRNLMAIRVQKPDIQRAVTASEARELGHSPKRGARKASIWVPVFERGQEHRVHQLAVERQLKWAKDTGIELRDIPAVVAEYNGWKEGKLQEIREDHDFLVRSGRVIEEEATAQIEDKTQQAVSLIHFLEEHYPDQIADPESAAQLEKIIQAAIDKVGVFNPHPVQQGQRVGWTIVPCVLDLGKDTEGPPIEMPGMKIDPEEGERFLKAASSFAEAKGVKVTTEAGGGGNGESGAVTVLKKRDGTQEEKIYLARWSGITSKCTTLLHEIAHYLAGHHREKQSKIKNVQIEQSKPQEHVAEATAYIVGRQFGIPVDYSAAYLKSWGATPVDLERHLATVRDLSKEMIVGIEAQLDLARREDQSLTRTETVSSDQEQQKGVKQTEKPASATAGQETFVRYQGRVYSEEQVTDLMMAFGASDKLAKERVQILHNLSQSGDNPRFHQAESLSAKNYQSRLLLEFAECAAENAGAKFVWIESDGNFNFAVDPDDMPEGIEAIRVSRGEEDAAVADVAAASSKIY